MAAIGRFTVYVFALLVAYIFIKLCFLYFGYDVGANSPSYYFGLIIGTVGAALHDAVKTA